MLARSGSWIRVAFSALFLTGGTPSPTSADTSSQLIAEGLAFSNLGTVELLSEELTITMSTTRARYGLRNTGSAPATIGIAFTLPELEFADPDVVWAIPGSDPVNFMDARTSIDGRPVEMSYIQKAFLEGKDVSAALTEAGLALVPLGDFHDRVGRLSAGVRDDLVRQRLLVASGTDIAGRPIHAPTWTVRTSAWRKQVVAAGQALTIEHRFRTSLGARQDTVLRKPLRDARGLEEEIRALRRDYCADDALLGAVDKLVGETEPNAARLGERRITYRLRGDLKIAPIPDFRLVIDKGAPDRLVSVCLKGLARISPTALEIRAKSFVPDQDLRLLIVGRF